MNIPTTLYRIRPDDFSPDVEVAACYIEHAGKILLLKRSSHKPQGNSWGVPAGKCEQGEAAIDAVFRETFEETGIRLHPDHVQPISPLYARQKGGTDFIYHTYYHEFDNIPEITLSDEHQEYRWCTFEEALTMPLIGGGIEALHHFKALSKKVQLPRKDFYFIRHGETDVNANPHHKRVDYDLPLNATGRRQAIEAREIIRSLDLNTVCYSPIQRAKETKDLLVEGLPLTHVEVPHLGECTADVWTNMVKLEQGQGYHVCSDVNVFFSTAIHGVHQAVDQEGLSLIVSHGGVHWALCYLLHIENHPWRIGNCQLVHFTPKKGAHGWEAVIF